MTLEDLRRLQTALSTGDANYFHGDMNAAFAEVVAELIELKEKGFYYQNRVTRAELAMAEITETLDNYKLDMEVMI